MTPQLLSVPFRASILAENDAGASLASGDAREVFPLASVTKLFTAYSALIAISRGLVTLSAPAPYPGVTLEHLLSHASGMAMGERAITRPPGTRRIYSNAGIEAAADMLEEATGTEIGRWIEETIAEPLGLTSLTVEGSPAYSGYAHAEDLMLFARELSHPTLISAELLDLATSVHFPHLDGIVPGYGNFRPCPWGIGAEIKGEKQAHWTAPSSSGKTFGHFGQSGSFLWVDPLSGERAVFLGEEPFGPWHRDNWSALNEEILHAMRGQ